MDVTEVRFPAKTPASSWSCEPTRMGEVPASCPPGAQVSWGTRQLGAAWEPDVWRLFSLGAEVNLIRTPARPGPQGQSEARGKTASPDGPIGEFSLGL